MGKIKLQKIAGKPSKIVLEWNDHLEIFSRPQAIENSRQYLLLRQDNPFTESSRWVPLMKGSRSKGSTVEQGWH